MSDLSDYDKNEDNNTPPKIINSAHNKTIELMPTLSKEKYEITYRKFIDWKDLRRAHSLSENVLLAYFDHLSAEKMMKSSTLWSVYSMLKTTISFKHNVNISSYLKLRAFLKRKSENYVPKKAKVLTPQQINEFLLKAPDEKYLLTKIGLVMGVAGACRKQELRNVKIEDLQDLNKALLVTIPGTKTKRPRTFTLTGNFYDIYTKYASYRPKDYREPWFFLKFQNNKCYKQVVGINLFGKMPSVVAKFLKLPNAELYTGHTFRRSSGMLSVNSGANILTLKRHGETSRGWRSSPVAEGYIEESVNNKMDFSNQIINAINIKPLPIASTSSVSTNNNSVFLNENPQLNAVPLSFNNCYNNTITINYYYNK